MTGAEGAVISKPTVGITTYQEDASWRGWNRHASLVPTDFLAAVAAAGGVPVLLPPYGGAQEAASVMGGLDGLLLVGGADIDPALYGRTAGPHTSGLAPDRDTWESALLRLALAEGRAVLGVCRGMQMINVLRGGTLTQHLPTALGSDDHQPSEPVFRPAAITLSPDQLPGSVVGDHWDIPCFHHQAVDTLGDGVLATGWSADGVIESVSMPDQRFVVGVQGHPEAAPVQALFAAFVAAAEEIRTARETTVANDDAQDGVRAA
ncbi:gamma-glutamyl-gamma-aminobutyrate hydrolase family protein [Streptomyces pinistramenti]|uniref:gamma-glutamyl-gamma-aminobutyrate hydrolase family protein n=1 Tax=Streptomyces pinistramenti TaxID=2884812 RepID=UPI001D063B7E|nr:gamma-glutamyl-gamma-aminobutyrate hydrolase family protein [Streptomyces pinistramenti]MCB5906288.1 gamma-glutamyl-gamma-aminobutyrate hydrolase family protein [Streptomyces pinistramenti]